jgi:hypothetical protein
VASESAPPKCNCSVEVECSDKSKVSCSIKDCAGECSCESNFNGVTCQCKTTLSHGYCPPA